MLLAGKGSLQKTHYDVLSVKKDATYDEIRASYRTSLLTSHPDKLQGKFETFIPHHKLQESFLDVQKAWEVLSDPRSREVYDIELQASREDLETADDVKLEDMVVEDVGEASEYFYRCRCGDYYSINSIELGEMGISLEGNGTKELQRYGAGPASVLLPCGSCSLKIRLVIDIVC